MPTPEEIKKIASEYAKEILSKQPMAAHAIPEMWEKAVADTEKPLAELFGPLISYIAKDYCIVPKSKVKEVMKYPQRHTELIQGTMHFQVIGIKKALINIFGKSLFEEGK